MVYSVGMPSSHGLSGLAGRAARFGFFALLLLSVCTSGGPESPAQKPEKADSILILKKEHVMELLANGKVLRSYKVALGQGGLAPKEREGDDRTPEGHYVIDAKYEHSAYHKALHVSYPDAEDRKRAVRLGVSPGGHHDPWLAEWERLGWSATSPFRLDARLHRGNQRGGRRGLEPGFSWYARRDPSLA